MIRKGKILTCSLVCLIGLLLITGCAMFTKYGQMEKQARLLYDKGDYNAAFYTCINALKMKPDYEKAQLLIQDAFPALVHSHEVKIEALKAAPDAFRWDAVVDEYGKLVKANQTVRSLPSLTNKKTGQAIEFQVTDYSADLLQAKTKAADAHYTAGDRFSKVTTLDSQKKAAKEFKTAERYVTGYRDAAERYERCRKAGIKRMAIIPFENRSGKTQFGAIEDMITDQVVSLIMNDPDAMEFLEIVSRDQLLQVMHEQQLGMTGTIDDQTAVEVGRVLGVHELLTGKITQIRCTPARTSRRTYRDTKRVATHKEKYRDDKGKIRERWVWADVNATVVEYTKTAGASISGSYQIVDVATARVKKSESFEGNGGFICEWAKFRGDERALSDASKRLASQAEGLAPTDDELVNQASDDLGIKLAATLKEYTM